MICASCIAPTVTSTALQKSDAHAPYRGLLSFVLLLLTMAIDFSKPVDKSNRVYYTKPEDKVHPLWWPILIFLLII